MSERTTGMLTGWRVTALLAVVVLVAGCNLREDASLFVANHSGAAWYLAVDSRDGMHFVAKVADGADGLALVWESGGDRIVSVLDMQCKVVGALEVQPDGSFAVAAVPGLTATIEARVRMGARVAEGVDLPSSDCGGEAYL